ncbi:Restriction of telomere capping protein 5 [Exophiala xenobiotica]|nr:Restriction of telomere capping protein 5 [Exophiala xenobiotica]
MGQSQSQSIEPSREIPIEQLSHELALRFASKCYTHLEIAHFKDNFKTLADHQEDLEYWKEDTLCRFLALPEPLKAGPVVYQMCTYLGAFPFPSLAPSFLTRENMLKIVTIMTGRYKKILKRGDSDKAKLLFRSMAVFDRRASISSPTKEKPSMDNVVREQLPEDMLKQREAEEGFTSHASGFAVDEPANDDEEEDDDDLALAALDSLDAIEVFKHDQRTDRKIHHAMIPAENFKRLVMLLLLMAGLEPLTPLGTYGESLSDERLEALDASASAIIAAFDPDPHSNGIKYSTFVKTVTTTLPDLFDPFSALFEHFLFSKNINLNKHRDTPNPVPAYEPKPSPIYRSPEDGTYSIFTDTLLSQLSMSLKLFNPSGSLLNIFTSNARFNRLYSSSSDGTSLSSFSRQVTSWQSGTLLLISGTSSDDPSKPVTLGAYLPERWHDPSSGNGSKAIPSSDPASPKPCLFQLQPRQALFPANVYNRTSPWSYFSSKSGIALGCVIPHQSRTNTTPQPPILGPVSLLIDCDISTATFQHDGSAGTGAFVTDPGLETAQMHHSETAQPKKVEFEIDSLEVWGISFPVHAGEDEVTKQQKRLAWEEAEAARRRGVNFGGDKDGARALLEMAGLVGDKAGSRSGGSV